MFNSIMNFLKSVNYLINVALIVVLLIMTIGFTLVFFTSGHTSMVRVGYLLIAFLGFGGLWMFFLLLKTRLLVNQLKDSRLPNSRIVHDILSEVRMRKTFIENRILINKAARDKSYHPSVQAQFRHLKFIANCLAVYSAIVFVGFIIWLYFLR